MYFYLSKLLAPFLNLTNLLLLLIIFFSLINFFYSKKIIRVLNKTLIVFFLLICFFPIGNFGFKYLEKNYLNQSEIIRVKNIFVLAGSEDIQNTKISKKLNLNNSSERLIASVMLANRYPNAEIYFVGGDGHLIKNSIDETTVALQFYKDVGFNLDRVIFINNTTNTIENLKEIKKIIREDSENILITSAFHMKRSMMIAKNYKLKLIPYAVDFRATSYNSIITYYQRFSVSKNLSSFDTFFREIIGILAFKASYQFT